MSDNYDDFQHFGRLGDSTGYGNNRVVTTSSTGNLQLTQAPATGAQLVFNGSEWVPQSILNEFTIFPVWAEEGGGLTNGSFQWSFGNGAVGDIGFPVGLDCELFAVTFQSEVFGTSVSIDVLRNNDVVATPVFNGAQGAVNVTAAPYLFGDVIKFRTNTENGNYSDARVCAWFRVKSTANFPTPDIQVAGISGLNFVATTFQDVAGLSVNVNLSNTGTVTGTYTYSALRSGAANAVTQFRVVIGASNGQTFFDTLSTFNDTGSVSHFVNNLPAGTYTVKVQSATDNPITITSASISANAVEN